MLCLHSKVSIFVIVIFTIYESKECRYVRHIRHFILLLRATDLMHIFHCFSEKPKLDSTVTCVNCNFEVVNHNEKYMLVTSLYKIKDLKSKKSNVICVNCQTSWLDPLFAFENNTNLCSYCGLDLYIVQKDSPKAISQTEKPKLDHKKHTVTCVNCNFKAINPTSNLCSNCGLDMLIKSSYKNCISCGSDYESKLTACPICGAN